MKRLILSFLMILPLGASALSASDFSGLEGWSIAAVTEVSGEFEGCEHDKKIRLTNGWTLTCGEYNYSYSYSPDVVVFSKRFEVRGRAYLRVKALIDDEMFDMQPIALRSSR